MLNTLKFFNRVKRLDTVCEGSKTQMSAELHEQAVLNIFTSCGVKPFLPAGDDGKANSHKFREWFKEATGGFIDFKKDYKSSYTIVSKKHPVNNYITPKTPWVVHQPNGSQNFPDMIVFKVIENRVNMLYIECKSRKPSFNNNPPKKNSNCIYICGNMIYNGYFLRSHENVAIYKGFLSEYKRLIERYREIEGYDMVPVFYKKNEFKSFPPPFFRDKQVFNDRLNKLLIKNILQ